MARSRLQQAKWNTRSDRLRQQPVVRRARRTAVALYHSTVRDTPAGRRITSWYRRRSGSGSVETEGRGWRRLDTEQALVITAVDDPEPRRGVYLFGGCDLPSAFALDSRLQAEPRGTVAIYREPRVNLARAVAPVALQTLDDLPVEATTETVERLGLPADYFSPVLFEPSFHVEGAGAAPFPKSVVLLSAGAEVVRSLYRHREHGFWVDPGGGWLDGVAGSAALDRDTMRWFTSTFEKVGRLDLAEYVPLYRHYLETVRERTGALVVLLNTLTVEPGDRTHNLQLRRSPEAIRRRRFHLAIAELSQELDIPVLDVDRALKWAGIGVQLDFAHFPSDKMEPLADELAAILAERGVI